MAATVHRDAAASGILLSNSSSVRTFSGIHRIDAGLDGGMVFLHSKCLHGSMKNVTLADDVNFFGISGPGPRWGRPFDRGLGGVRRLVWSHTAILPLVWIASEWLYFVVQDVAGIALLPIPRCGRFHSLKPPLKCIESRRRRVLPNHGGETRSNASPCDNAAGPIAQRQSRGLIIPWFQVRILVGPIDRYYGSAKYSSDPMIEAASPSSRLPCCKEATQ